MRIGIDGATSTAAASADVTTDDEEVRTKKEHHSGWRWAIGPTGLLVIVAALYFALQIVLFDESRFLEWDEAVYIGRSAAKFNAPPWSSHRAPGVSWILTPSFLVSSSFVWMRVYLAMVSTLAIALGFSAWREATGRQAALAMALFCSSWLVLFYGSEASPNLYVAACTVGAIGMVARPGRLFATPAYVAVAVATAVLLRPSDGAMLAAAVVVGAYVTRARHRIREIVFSVAIAVILGMIPWTVESIVAFDGPLHRWRLASEIVDSSIQWQASNYARLLDGPLVGPDQTEKLSYTFVLIATLYIVTAVVAVATRRVMAITLALGAAAFMALPYLFYVGASAPRFLLPAIGLLCIATSGIAPPLVKRHRAVGGLLIAAFVAAGVVNVGHANEVESEQALRRSELIEVARITTDLAAGEPCQLFTPYAVTQLLVSTDCDVHSSGSDVGCQLSEFGNSDLVVVVAALGTVPAEVEDALLSEVVEGSLSWIVMQVDPDSAGAGCDNWP